MGMFHVAVEFTALFGVSATIQMYIQTNLSGGLRAGAGLGGVCGAGGLWYFPEAGGWKQN